MYITTTTTTLYSTTSLQTKGSQLYRPGTKPWRKSSIQAGLTTEKNNYDAQIRALEGELQAQCKAMEEELDSSVYYKGAEYDAQIRALEG